MNYCKNWMTIIGTNLLTLIMYTVFLFRYSKRYALAWFVSIGMILLLVGSASYVVSNRRQCSPTFMFPQVVVMAITLLGVIVFALALPFSGRSDSDSDVARALFEPLSGWGDLDQNDSVSNDSVSNDSVDDTSESDDCDPAVEGSASRNNNRVVLDDPDSWMSRKKYCDLLGDERFENRACQNDNYQVDRAGFKITWDGSPKTGDTVFDNCDTDRNGWITPDEPPCSLSQAKTSRCGGSRRDKLNTHSSGCKLPGKGEGELDKFLECVGNKRSLSLPI